MKPNKQKKIFFFFFTKNEKTNVTYKMDLLQRCWLEPLQFLEQVEVAWDCQSSILRPDQTTHDHSPNLENVN